MSTDHYGLRRQQLIDALPANSIALIPAAEEVTRSRDTEYTFRQNSDFYYLTGFAEPDAWLVLSNSADHPQQILYCRGKDKMAEIWHGRRLGPEQAMVKLGIEHAADLAEFDEELLTLLDGKAQLWFAQGELSHADHMVEVAMETLRQAPKQSRQAPTIQVDPRPLLHEMRLFKSEQEIKLMEKAAEISVAAHQRAMQHSRPGVTEYQLEAEILHQFAYHGARSAAYNTIVGGGENACILHYTDNADTLLDGDLVLIDAGAEYQGYAADITRTFPVNGRFSAEQKTLYQLVLDAQLAAMEWVKPGHTLVEAANAAVKVITQGLIDLGILHGELEDNIEQKTYREYFMHGLGHWLGLDVHDVGLYKQEGQDRPFEPGMVLTVEPGIYIAPDADVDAKWQGIGIRIEDNLLVTEQGHRNLTGSLAKTVDEIEAFMAKDKAGAAA